MIGFKGKNDFKLGLVLSGGGAKGAYEIGVYLALLKLGMKVDIVTGTSIGAINGVFIVQNDVKKALKLWENISFSMVYDEDEFDVCDNPDLIDVYMEYVKNFIVDGGMDIDKIKLIFDEYYNPRKFFSSVIDFGLVTYNLSLNKPVFMKKSDLKPETVKDYVIASASCYPAFKPHKIGDELFIDGGYYDNLPIDLAVSLGADEVIAVDLRAVGFKRPMNYGVPVTVISPRNKIVSFLVFDKSSSREALRFGYNDAMKTFGYYDGNIFTFKKGDFVKNYNKYGDLFSDKVRFFLSSSDVVLGKLVSSSIFKSIVDKKVTYKNFNRVIEKAGISFGFDESNVYDIRSYNKGLLSEFFKVLPINSKDIVSKVKERKFKDVIDARPFIRLFYDFIVDGDVRGVIKFLPMFSDEFLIAVYLFVLND